MSGTVTEAPEGSEDSLNDTLTIRCSKSEKQQAVMVAALNDVSMSKMLRARSLEDVLAEAERIRERHRRAEVTS